MAGVIIILYADSARGYLRDCRRTFLYLNLYGATSSISSDMVRLSNPAYDCSSKYPVAFSDGSYYSCSYLDLYSDDGDVLG